MADLTREMETYIIEEVEKHDFDYDVTDIRSMRFQVPDEDYECIVVWLEYFYSDEEIVKEGSDYTHRGYKTKTLQKGKGTFPVPQIMINADGSEGEVSPNDPFVIKAPMLYFNIIVKELAMVAAVGNVADDANEIYLLADYPDIIELFIDLI